MSKTQSKKNKKNKDKFKNSLKKMNSEFHPTKKWLNEYRISTIDTYIIDGMFDRSIEESIYELNQLLNDEIGLFQNFPGFTKKEMEIFLDEQYLRESKFIKKLKLLLEEDQRHCYSSYTKSEKEWIEKNLIW